MRGLPSTLLGLIGYPQQSFSERPLEGSEITSTCVALLALVRLREHPRRGRGGGNFGVYVQSLDIPLLNC